MKNILVAYFSQTGNTQKIAEAIFGVLPQPKEIISIPEVKDLTSAKLVFIGFPVQSHSVPYPVEQFLRQVPDKAKIALFSTHGSLTGSALSREAIHYATVVASQAVVMGSFSCRGQVSSQAMEVLGKSPEHEAWADMAVSASTHPDASDLEDARAFARWVLTLSRSRVL